MSKQPKKYEEQMKVAREVMARRKDALETLAQIDLAERIMREDEEILRGLSKK